jgi:hypothetical protein
MVGPQAALVALACVCALQSAWGDLELLQPYTSLARYGLLSAGALSNASFLGISPGTGVRPSRATQHASLGVGEWLARADLPVLLHCQ